MQELAGEEGVAPFLDRLLTYGAAGSATSNFTALDAIGAKEKAGSDLHREYEQNASSVRWNYSRTNELHPHSRTPHSGDPQPAPFACAARNESPGFLHPALATQRAVPSQRYRACAWPRRERACLTPRRLRAYGGCVFPAPTWPPWS